MALPPVFVEFIGSAGKLYATTAAVRKEIASVNGSGMAAGMEKGKAAATSASLAVVGAAGLFTIASLKMATTFQSNMEVLHTAAGYTQASLKALGDGVLQIAQETGTPTTQLTDGLYTIAKAGFSAKDALQVESAAAQGAADEHADLGTVTQALTSVMRSYHMTAGQSVQAMDMMKTAAGESKTNLQDFAGSMAAVVPIASSLGIKFDEVGGAIGVMTSHGESAQQSTDNLANVFRNFAKPSNVAITMMQQLGISAVDVQKSLSTRGLAGTYQYLTSVIAAHTKGGLVNVGTMKMSAAASKDLQQMMSGMGSELRGLSQGYLDGSVDAKTYTGKIKTMDGVSYAQGTQFKALANTVMGFSQQARNGTSTAITTTDAMSRMTGGATGLKVALMLTGQNMPALIDKTKKIADASKHAGKQVDGFSDYSNTLGAKVAMLHETINTWMIQLGTKLIPIITTVVSWLIKHKDVVKDVAIAIGIMAAGWLILNGIMGGSPLMLIVKGLALLTAGFIYAYNHSKTFRDIVQKIGDVFNWLWKNVLVPVGKFIGSVIVAEIKGIIAYFKFWWQVIKDIGAAAVWLWKNVLEPVGKFIGGAFMATFKAVGDFFSGAFKMAVQAAINVFKFFQQIPADIQRLWGALVGWFKGLWRDITGALVGAATWLQQIGSDIIHGMWNGITTAWTTVTTWLGNIGQAIIGFFTGAVSWLLKAGSDILGGLWQGITNVWNGMVTWFGNLPGVVGNFFANAAQWLLNAGENLLKGLWQGIENGLSWLWQQIQGLAGSIVSAFESALGIHSPSRVMAESVGKFIPMGIAQGMLAHAYHVQNAANSIASGINGMSFGSPAFGGMGSGGGGGGQVVNLAVTVQGTVTSENDLMQTIKTQMLQQGARIGASKTFQPFRR